MPRALDTTVLDDFARRMSAEWRRGVSTKSTTVETHVAHLKRFLPHPLLTDAERKDILRLIAESQAKNVRWLFGPNLVVQDMYNLTYKDEFDYVRQALMDEWFTGKEKAAFEDATRAVFTPRDDRVFEGLLKTNLALSPAGDHVDGEVGRANVGFRPTTRRLFEVEARWSLMRRKETGLPYHLPSRTDRVTVMREGWDRWPIYIGEGIEREAGRIRTEVGVGPGADPLPEGTPGLPVGANVPNFSAETCQAWLDAFDTSVNEGDAAAEIRHRTGSQPADPDAAETGTLLGTNPMSDPAFGAAADDGDGTVSLTAASITEDSSADATGTAAYFRMAATGTGADDHLDGTIGTASTDLVMNTVSYVSGSTISITSFVVGLSQGSTAT